MRSCRFVAIALLFLATGLPAQAQLGRVIRVPVPRPFVPRPIVPPVRPIGGHMPHVPVPHGGPGHAAGASDWDDWMPWIWTAVAVIGVGIARYCLREPAARETPYPGWFEEPPPDIIRSSESVAAKVTQTETLLADLAWQGLPLPAALKQWVEGAFMKIQQSWHAQDLTPVADLVTKMQVARYNLQIANMNKNGLANHLAELSIDRIEFVHVDFEGADKCEFSALITFRAQSYFVDCRSRKWRCGTFDRKQFQEFWTFERAADSWQLTGVARSTDASLLARPNYATMTTAGPNPGVFEMNSRHGDSYRPL